MFTDSYHFSKKTYPEPAAGWQNGVYTERRAVISEADSPVTEPGQDYLTLSSLMWTETESTGFGIYPYVESLLISYPTGLVDGKWTVTFTNPTALPYAVGIYADEVLQVQEVSVAPGADQTVSFVNCSIHETTTLQFFVPSKAAAKEEAGCQQLYLKELRYEQLPAKAPGHKPTIFIASDSTVQTYEEFYYPQTGWGQVFCQYLEPESPLNDYRPEDLVYPQCHVYERDSVIVENRSIGARSSRSFIDEGKWNALLKRARPGDYCMIQWAHNDATAIRPNRYVSAHDYDFYLMKYINSCRSRGIHCILVTPVSRRNCDENGGTFSLSFAAYRDVMRKVGARESIPVVDLCKLSCDYLTKIGPEESKSLYLWCPKGAYPDGAYADGVSDNAHLQEYGAKVYARLVADALLHLSGFQQLEPIQALIRPGAEPSKPQPLSAVHDADPLIPSGFALQELHIVNKMANFLLIWNDVPGAVSYNVYRKGSVDFQFFPLRSVSREEKKTATVLPFSLPASDVYQVHVTAVFEDGRESKPGRTIEFRA